MRSFTICRHFVVVVLMALLILACGKVDRAGTTDETETGKAAWTVQLQSSQPSARLDGQWVMVFDAHSLAGPIILDSALTNSKGVASFQKLPNSNVHLVVKSDDFASLALDVEVTGNSNVEPEFQLELLPAGGIVLSLDPRWALSDSAESQTFTCGIAGTPWYSEMIASPSQDTVVCRLIGLPSQEQEIAISAYGFATTFVTIEPLPSITPETVENAPAIQVDLLRPLLLDANDTSYKMLDSDQGRTFSPTASTRYLLPAFSEPDAGVIIWHREVVFSKEPRTDVAITVTIEGGLTTTIPSNIWGAYLKFTDVDGDGWIVMDVQVSQECTFNLDWY